MEARSLSDMTNRDICLLNAGFAVIPLLFHGHGTVAAQSTSAALTLSEIACGSRVTNLSSLCAMLDFLTNAYLLLLSCTGGFYKIVHDLPYVCEATYEFWSSDWANLLQQEHCGKKVKQMLHGVDLSLVGMRDEQSDLIQQVFQQS